MVKSIIDKQDLVELSIPKYLYEKEAVFAAAYRLTGKLSISIEPESATHIRVSMQRLPKYRKIDLAEAVQQFKNHLLDEQLRFDLEKRFGAIRELIVKQAFSPIENLSEEVTAVAGRT
jgi:His-Xaa-Ser system protein HxsD